jgi:hypothetical protein
VLAISFKVSGSKLLNNWRTKGGENWSNKKGMQVEML